jgi:dihydropteroate synthase
LRTRSLDVSKGVIMGVINVTPDSFSDGGAHLDRASAVAAGLEMARQGAAIIDVGGESTRPGATPVTVEEELLRVLPVVEALAAAGLVVSVDTSKPEVARSALEAGAEIVNDVTAAAAPGMREVLAGSRAGVVLMHMKGSPGTMQEDPRYDDVLEEVAAFLEARARLATDAGVDAASIAVDPGIGFGKTVRHNLVLIEGLGRIGALGHPVVLGASRKSFLGKLTGIDPAEGRDGVTAVTTALGFERGARVFRVHDVLSSLAALRVVGAIVSPERWEEWSPA